MKIKIRKDKRCGMRKLAKNRESRQFNQSWDIRNTSSMNE
jgi:RimJ/RimL family protein N-acetyltransferase